MVLEKYHSADVKNKWIAEMAKSLLPYGCAAKKLAGHRKKKCQLTMLIKLDEN